MATTFSDLDLLDSLQQTLQDHELTTLTEIQRLALPKMMDRRSLLAIAETGSGKTLTYVLPVLDHLKRLEDAGNAVELNSEPRALVLVPTRELADQVARVFKSFTHATRIRVRFALGGQKLRRSRDNVAGVFEVLVATPGRLDLLLEREALSLDGTRIVVLDEADQLFDLGFLRQVLALVQRLPGRRQLSMFSATMPEPLRELLADLFPDMEIIRSSGSEKLVPTLTTRHVNVPNGRRYDVLPDILREPTEGGTILFGNTREQCDGMVDRLRSMGFECAVIRGDMEAPIRRRHLADFRSGVLPLLVATDMAGRGLDIEHVGRVINVHLPHSMDNYLHRVGRTARAGREGLVINLVTPRDAPLIAKLDDGHEAPVWDRESGGR